MSGNLLILVRQLLLRNRSVFGEKSGGKWSGILAHQLSLQNSAHNSRTSLLAKSKIWGRIGIWPTDRPLFGLKAFTTTIDNDVNDLPLTSPHGRDSRKMQKIENFQLI